MLCCRCLFDHHQRLRFAAFICLTFSNEPSDGLPENLLDKNTDFQNFHVCGKNQTCVGIANDYLNYHVCGFYHTCVDFTKDMSRCLVKTTHVWEDTNMCVYFKIQGGTFCICFCI